MNKTVTVNIASIVFHIDEDAYGKLNTYLENIRNSINTEGREEIIHDIENRIAELFSERINTNNQVIMLKDVDYIIQIMGQPKDYVLDEDEDENKPNETKKEKAFYQKKLYRDGNQKILGGVLSGLAHYIKIDVVWLRIIFIIALFFYGTSFLIYLILWIIIPKAKTTTEILEMTGEPINISSIEKKVRENKDYEPDRNANIKTNNNIPYILRKMLGILCIIFAFIGIFSSTTGNFLMLNNRTYSNIPSIHLLHELSDSIWYLWILFFIISCIPPILLFLVGLKLLYANLKYIGITCLVLIIGWFITCSFTALVLVKHSKDIKNIVTNNISKSFKEINFQTTDDLSITNDTLKIVFVNNEYFESDNNKIDDFKTDIVEEQNNILLKIEKNYKEESTLKINLNTERNKPYHLNYKENKPQNEPQNNDSIKINLKIKKQKQSYLDSIENNFISPTYNYKIEQNLLIFSDSILNKESEDFMIKKVKIYVSIPKNIIIGLDKNSNSFINKDLSNTEEFHYYRLKNETLECIDCP